MQFDDEAAREQNKTNCTNTVFDLRAEERKKDLKKYFEKCTENLIQSPAVEYLNNRGISLETAMRFGVGYDESADPSGKGFKEPRVILPVNDLFYISKRVNCKFDAFDTMNNVGSTSDIFNKEILFSEVENIFLVKDYFDALSIYEIGEEAIALNNVSNQKKLIDLLEKRSTKSTLILSLNADDKKTSENIAAALKRLNISFVVDDLSCDHGCPNGALIKDRIKFEEAVKKAIRRSSSKPDDIGTYIQREMLGEIDRFKKADKLKTGFINLDAKDKAGGFHTGLYCVAAISSLGKTTFIHQIADYIAESGNDVLFFSLEQSRLELVSKSISRMTAKIDKKNAVTSLEIREGHLNENVLQAIEIYQKSVSGKLSIVEGNFNCNISYIGNYIRRYINNNGGKEKCRPVVIIDYLQILQADQGVKAKQKRESVDSSVTELKRISRENDITVIIISSVNRANYLMPIDFESLKESGGIEYTCDVVWGMQLQVLNDELFNKTDKTKEKREKISIAKKTIPRKIELKCLKNRYGTANFSCYFDYDPRYDLFSVGELEREYVSHRKAGTRL